MSSRYSADVEIYLLIGDSRYDVANCYNNTLVLSSPTQLEAGIAEFVLRIDDETWNKRVILDDSCPSPEGIVTYTMPPIEPYDKDVPF